jgi:hypothetical protein
MEIRIAEHYRWLMLIVGAALMEMYVKFSAFLKYFGMSSDSAQSVIAAQSLIPVPEFIQNMSPIEQTLLYAALFCVASFIVISLTIKKR